MTKTPVDVFLDELAVATLQVTQTGRDHFFLYVEVEPGVVSPSFFQVVDTELIYTEPTREMSDAIWRRWRETDPAERWRALRFELIGGWYKAEFDCPTPPGAPELALFDEAGDGNPNELEEQDRRMLAALRMRFGEEATIVYPSITRRPLQRSLDFTGTEPFGSG